MANIINKLDGDSKRYILIFDIGNPDYNTRL